jgi:putative endonuclease
MRADRRRAYVGGRRAEAIACWLLRAKGYRILARNWRCPLGEIDILARRGPVLAAIEVKRRSTGASALESVGIHQRRRIERALLAYVARHPHLAQLDWRFDAIAVLGWGWPRHVTGAWRPELG